MKIWLAAETFCTGIVALLTILAAVYQSKTIHTPDDGENHLYFPFLLQFLLLNMVPHNVSEIYIHRKMRNWRLRRIKTL